MDPVHLKLNTELHADLWFQESEEKPRRRYVKLS